MSKELKLALLGVPQILLDAEPLHDQLAPREQALLFYLAVNGRTYPRTAIATLFWEKCSDQRALKNLRDLLPNLRRHCGEYLTITYHTVGFDRKSTYWLDVDAFQDGLQSGAPSDLRRLYHVLALYRHEFLTDFHVRDAPGFEQWMLLQRSHLKELAVKGWDRVVSYHIEQNEYEQGLSAVKQLLALEPWREGAHQQMMLLLARMGQRSSALAHYAVCQQILQAELDTTPSAETVALYEQIKAGAFNIPQPSAATVAKHGSTSGGSQAQTVNPPPVDAVEVDTTHDQVNTPPTLPQLGPPAVQPVNWSAIPRLHKFHGREREVAQVEKWVGADHCRLVAILGIGGQGKTTLVTHLVHTLAEESLSPSASPASVENKGQVELHTSYKVILWHSLLNAPPLNEILHSWLLALSNQTVTTIPATFDQQFALLLGYLQQQRCLLVLDNLESILDRHTLAADYQARSDDAYRPGYEAYGELLRRLVKNEHQSCLLFTSRERPRELARLEEESPLVRTLHLGGLSIADGQTMLQASGLTGPQATVTRLIRRYAGNPLALNLVAETIWEIFDGDVEAFAQEETMLFADIRQVLDQTFARLSPVEYEIVLWLAIEREPVRLATLRANVVQEEVRRQVVEGLRVLTERFWVEKQENGFGLQNVVLEYITDYLSQTFCRELIMAPWLASQSSADSSGIPVVQQQVAVTPKHDLLSSLVQSHLNRFALIKAQAQEYIRESQVRLLLQPVAERLTHTLGAIGVVDHLLHWVNYLRHTVPRLPGYAGANLLHLLLHHQADHAQIDWRKADFSYVTLWQAYLRTATITGINFSNADLTNSVFAESFDVVFSLAFSPNDTLLAAGTYLGEIRLWRIANQQPYRILMGHESPVAAVAFDPASASLVSGSMDKTVRLWDIETGNCRLVLNDYAASVLTVAFSPDGQAFAASGDAQTIWVHNSQSGAILQTLVGHTERVHGLAFSRDGKILASASYDQTVRLWDLTTGETKLVLQGHTSAVYSVAFGGPPGLDSPYLVSGGVDQTVRLWETATGQCLAIMQGHTGIIGAVAFSPTGETIASGSDDFTVRLWDVQTAQLRMVLPGHTNWVRAVAFGSRVGPEGPLLASGSFDQSVRLWDSQTGQVRHVFVGYGNRMSAVTLHPTGDTLAVGSVDGKIQMFDSTTGHLQRQFIGHTSALWGVAFSPDGRTLASCGDDRIIGIWDVQTGKRMQKLRGHEAPVKSVAFRPDGALLASGGGDKTIRLWDVQTGQSVLTLTGHQLVVLQVAFSPDGALLASGSDDDTLRMWWLPGGDLWYVQQVGDAVTTLAFSPDGSLLVSGHTQGMIQLWSTLSGQRQTSFQQGASCITATVFSPDGAILATGGHDRTIRLWSVRTGTLQRTLTGHRHVVSWLAFHADGKRLLSSSTDETIKVWDWQTGSCLQTFHVEGPYSNMNITGVVGLTAAQKTMLRGLGAVEE